VAVIIICKPTTYKSNGWVRRMVVMCGYGTSESLPADHAKYIGWDEKELIPLASHEHASTARPIAFDASTEPKLGQY
jgi:hypothetical protein